MTWWEIVIVVVFMLGSSAPMLIQFWKMVRDDD